LAEDLAPNLDIVLDFRFTEIEAELFVVLEHLKTVERQLPQIVESERERLGREELPGIDDEDEYHDTVRWIEEFAEEVLPRLYRLPPLVELWAVFESGVVEIAKYLQKEQGHSLSINDLRANNDFERARKYYQDVLRLPLITSDHVKERLDTLVLVRHALAHCNGRIEVIREDRLKKIQNWEKRNGELSTDGQYLNFTNAFIETMASAVKTALEDLIARVKKLS
jgi:hypothetical protein